MYYANDLSQISVIGTYGSILESGSMFDKCIKNKVSYDINVNTKYMIDSDDSIFVTGMMGNQLFGPTNEHSNNGTENTKVPITSVVTTHPIINQPGNFICITLPTKTNSLFSCSKFILPGIKPIGDLT